MLRRAGHHCVLPVVQFGFFRSTTTNLATKRRKQEYSIVSLWREIHWKHEEYGDKMLEVRTGSCAIDTCPSRTMWLRVAEELYSCTATNRHHLTRLLLMLPPQLAGQKERLHLQQLYDISIHPSEHRKHMMMHSCGRRISKIASVPFAFG